MKLYRNVSGNEFKDLGEEPEKMYAEDIRDYMNKINEFFRDIDDEEESEGNFNNNQEESSDMSLPPLQRNFQRFPNLQIFESDEDSSLENDISIQHNSHRRDVEEVKDELNDENSNAYLGQSNRQVFNENREEIAEP